MLRLLFKVHLAFANSPTTTKLAFKDSLFILRQYKELVRINDAYLTGGEHAC